MQTFRLLGKLPVWVLGACLSIGGGSTAFAVDEVGLFELEGNAVDGGSLGALPDDWETLCDPVAVPGGPCQNPGPGPGPNGHAEVFTGIIPDPYGESIFTGGRTDIQDIGDWGHKGGAVPDKNEITNAYAAAYTNITDTLLQDIGDLIIYFGSDRYANAGDAFMGYWFFQDEVKALPDGSFEGVHIPGDILVLANYPQSANAVPEIQVVSWDPTCNKADKNPLPGDCAASNLRLRYSDVGAGARCAPGAADQLACAISNTEGGFNDPTPSPWPYIAKTGEVNSFPYETFLSGGVNISQLLPDATGCFASFMAETRSSSSFTASLKDFVLDEFELCGIAATKMCEATLSTDGDEAVVEFDGTVTNNGAVALEVTLSDDMGDITAVCYDDGTTAGECGGGNTLPEPIGTNTDIIIAGVAYFELLGGEKVLFEGTYTEDTLVFDAEGKAYLTDEVSVTATLIDKDVVVVDDFAEATCYTTGIPGIDVNKNCNANIADNGRDLVVAISGTGSNDGQVKLVDVTLSDDKGASIDTIKVDSDIPSDGTYEVTVTNGAFDLLPGQAFMYEGSLLIEDATTTLHSDTVTASGKNVFDQAGDAITDTGNAECAGAPAPGIAVSKECDVLLEAQASPARIVLKVDFDGVVRNTGNIELTNVTVTDDIVGVVATNVTLAPNDGAEGGDDEYSYNGSYYPSVGEGQEVPTASELSTQDTVTAAGTGAFGAGTVNTDTVANGSTPAQVTAECYLCDDDGDHIPDVLDPDSGPVVP